MFNIFIYIILCVLCGMYASGKGKSFGGYFFLSLFLSPLIGFIVALIAKEDFSKIEKNQLKKVIIKKCIYCAELVKIEAIVCKHCGKDLPKNGNSSNLSDDSLSEYLKSLK